MTSKNEVKVKFAFDLRRLVVRKVCKTGEKVTRKGL